MDMPNYPKIVTKPDIQRGLDELQRLRDMATMPYVRAILDDVIRQQVHVLNQWDAQSSALDKFIEFISQHTITQHTLRLGYGDSDVITWYVDERENEAIQAIYKESLFHPNYDYLIEEIDEGDGDTTRFVLKAQVNFDGK